MATYLMSTALFAQQSQPLPFRDAVSHFIQSSDLTREGAQPFHLTASVIETTNPSSPYHAEIEEYWASPTQWRRTIVSPSFKQTIVANGEAYSEQNEGDYYPLWLRNVVRSIFNPVDGAQLLQSTAMIEAPVQMPMGGRSIPCAQPSKFDVYCFYETGLLQMVNTPGYEATFTDYQPFGNESIPRRRGTELEPGTSLLTSITNLESLPESATSTFKIPATSGDPIQSVQVSASTLDGLRETATPVVWPTVRSGSTAGVVRMYYSADRSGKVRETYPLPSTNEGLVDPVRQQVETWRLKPLIKDGAQVQTEGVLTLPFNTSTANPLPVLTNEEARKLALRVVEPTLPPNTLPLGTRYRIRISVNEQGIFTGGADGDADIPGTVRLKGPGVTAVMLTLRQWRFKPLVRDGRPQYFRADLIFVAQ